MELRLIREKVEPSGHQGAPATIGQLFADGIKLCDTLEPQPFKFIGKISADSVRKAKQVGPIAIPPSRYRIRMDIQSPQYYRSMWMRAICGAFVPRLMNVPGFTGILIHPGNSVEDTTGCILVGVHDALGHISSSRDMFVRVFSVLRDSYLNGFDNYISIESCLG